MSHIQQAPGADVLPIEVTYLPGFEYDHLKFGTYPDRIGFANNGVLDFNRPSRQLVSMAQAWLFFGVVESYTGLPLVKSSFLRNKNDAAGQRLSQVVDTSGLSAILGKRALNLRIDTTRHVKNEVKRQVRQLSRSWQPHLNTVDTIESIIGIASGVIGVYSTTMGKILTIMATAFEAIDALESVQNGDPISAAVFLSSRLLVESMVKHLDIVLFDKSSGSQVFPSPPILGPRLLEPQTQSAHLLVQRMTEVGWCRSQAVNLRQSYGYNIVYYLSSIRRQEPSHINHNRCFDTKCLAHNADGETYLTRHVNDHCQCGWVATPPEKITSIIAVGGIPLIKIFQRPHQVESVELEVLEYTKDTQYTAISHVWADGLGTPHGNALPKCQLLKLARQVSSLPNAKGSSSSLFSSRSENLFWLDTLCIPVGFGNSELRQKAINKMAVIYSSAAQVRVLDGELEQVSHEAEPWELIDARILCSKWNTRCWTLQEAALAHRIYFQFRKSSIPVEASRHYLIISHKISSGVTHDPDEWPRFFEPSELANWRYFDDITLNYLRATLCTLAGQSIHQDLERRPKGPPRLWRRQRCFQRRAEFRRTWNDIGKRSTTKPEDIHIILANLTDFSAAQIMALKSPVERTKGLLHCQRSFPIDVLYNEAPRPEAGGDHHSRPHPLIEHALVRCTDKGLLFDPSDSRTNRPGRTRPRLSLLSHVQSPRDSASKPETMFGVGLIVFFLWKMLSVEVHPRTSAY